MNDQSHTFWSNGVLREIVNGTLRRELPQSNGTARWWHANGVLAKEMPMVNGKSEGIIREWHENGQLRRETPTVRGVTHGIVRQWASDGRFLGEFELHQGKGVSREWNEDGSLKIELEIFEEGCHRGRIWDENGKPRDVYLWNGRPISKNKFIQKLANKNEA